MNTMKAANYSENQYFNRAMTEWLEQVKIAMDSRNKQATWALHELSYLYE